MKCRHCGADNHEDDHRCTRCMRRLRTGPQAEWANRTSAAPDPVEPAAQAVEVGRTAATEPAPLRRLVYQTPLFGPQVIPSQSAGKRHAQRTASPRRQPAETLDPQQSLFILQTAGAATARKTPVEPSFSCEATVALPVHRTIAAALDASMVLIATGAVFAVFAAAGGELVVNSLTWKILAAVPLGVIFLYRALWCIGNGDTPGMRWMRLKLIHFDGRRPSRKERLVRNLAGCLSLLAAGLGLWWALTDEERLTWHDHISRTFPTAV